MTQGMRPHSWEDPNVSDMPTQQDFHVGEVRSINSARRANLFLAHGYRLIGVYAYAEPVPLKSGAESIRKGVTFVLARPINVEPYEPPADRPAPEAGG